MWIISAISVNRKLRLWSTCCLNVKFLQLFGRVLLCGVCRIGKLAINWSVEKTFLISQCSNNSGKQRLYRCVVAVFIYHIWKEKNHRRMQDNTGRGNCEAMQTCDNFMWQKGQESS